MTQDITLGAVTGGNVVDFTGTSGARRLTGLAAGTLSGLSTDAVTGAQLFSTHADVAANTSAIAVNTADIATGAANFPTTMSQAR